MRHSRIGEKKEAGILAQEVKMSKRKWTYQYKITKGNQEYKTGTIWGFSPSEARDFFMGHPDVEGDFIGRIPY